MAQEPKSHSNGPFGPWDDVAEVRVAVEHARGEREV
jgi:hypothetical protein